MGFHLLWGDLRYVRELRFESASPIELGKMTAELWTDAAS